VVQFRVVAKIFLLPTALRPVLGPHRHLPSAYRGSFNQRAKRPGHEYQSRTPNEIKNVWSYNFTPTYAVITLHLIKHSSSICCLHEYNISCRLQSAAHVVLWQFSMS